jgi:hypothetical protein
VQDQAMLAVTKSGLGQGMLLRLERNVGDMTSGTDVIIKEITKKGIQCFKAGGDANKTELVRSAWLREISTEKQPAVPKFNPSTLPQGFEFSHSSSTMNALALKAFVSNQFYEIGIAAAPQPSSDGTLKIRLVRDPMSVVVAVDKLKKGEIRFAPYSPELLDEEPADRRSVKVTLELETPVSASVAAQPKKKAKTVSTMSKTYWIPKENEVPADHDTQPWTPAVVNPYWFIQEVQNAAYELEEETFIFTINGTNVKLPETAKGMKINKQQLMLHIPMLTNMEDVAGGTTLGVRQPAAA